MNPRRSFLSHLLELTIAGVIFSGLILFGLYTFNYKIVSADGNVPKRTSLEDQRNNPGKPSKETFKPSAPLVSTPLPSQEELLRQMIGARSSMRVKQPNRQLEPWEEQIRQIDHLAISPEEKVRRLVDLAKTLPEEEQALLYSAACSLAPSTTYQQKLYPLVWNPQIPGPVARAVAAGVLTEPDSFKFPALLALQRHPDEETRAMALSVLWAYFPEEPAANYSQAIQRFLSGQY